MPFDTVAPFDIGRVIADHAAAAIRAQESLDRAARRSEVPAARMRIRMFEFSSEWGLERAAAAAFEIKATPLNLSYRVSRRLTASSDLRISVIVEQLPLPQGSTVSSTSTKENNQCPAK